MKSKVSVVKCDNYKKENIESALKKAIDSLGGIANFIKPASRVLLKPNLLMAIEPEKAITTHPELARSVIRILKNLDAKIYLGDAPSVWGKPQDLKEVYGKTGMSRLAAEEGVELIEFTPSQIKRGLPLASIIDEVDFIISVPKFKTHSFMTLTGAVKNLFGLVCGLHKTELHRQYFKPEQFAKKLVDIYEIVRPTLTIVDAIDVLEGNGPATGGDLRHLGLIIVSADCVAIDSVLARIMNIMPQRIPVIKEARSRNLGNSELSSIEIIGENLKDIITADFKLPPPSLMHKVPLGVFNLFKGLLNYRPDINPKLCVRCKKCQAICPAKIISIEPQIKIDYSGCIKCFCCLEACPERAISIKKSLAAKIMGLRG